jgi:hypothetical protein
VIRKVHFGTLYQKSIFLFGLGFALSCKPRTFNDAANNSDVAASGVVVPKSDPMRKVVGRLGMLHPKTGTDTSKCWQNGVVAKDCTFFGNCTFSKVFDVGVSPQPFGLSAAHCAPMDADLLFAELDGQVAAISRAASPEDYEPGNYPKDYMVFPLPKAWATKGSPAAKIASRVPTVSIPSADQAKVEKGLEDLLNSPQKFQGLTRFHADVPGLDISKMPEVHFVGFGLANAFTFFSTQRVPEKKETCLSMGAMDGNKGAQKMVFRWDEASGSCVINTETIKRVNWTDPENPRRATMRWVGTEKKAKMGMALPDPKQPEHFTCMGDSGGPGFLPGTLEIVGIVVSGYVPCKGGYMLFVTTHNLKTELANLWKQMK